MSKQRKPKAQSNLHLLDAEQRAALSTFQKDFKTALPHMQELGHTAQRMHQSMVDAPIWSVVDAPKPDEPVQEQGMWSVGHAKINYVDHIETEGTQDK